jgi:murein L,D-transpeptidase YcbB/YkuD
MRWATRIALTWMILWTSTRAEELSPAARDVLRAAVVGGKEASLLRPSFAEDRERVRWFYEAGAWDLAWVRLSRPTEQALILIDALRGAEAKGLDPLEYDGPRWTERLAQLVHPASVRSESSWIDFDVALTVSALRYVSDLQRGRLRTGPARTEFDGAEALDAAEFLRERVVGSSDVHAALATLEPPFAAYRRTLEALETYRRLALEDDGARLSISPRPIAPGDPYADAPRLAQVLRRVGDLRPDAALPANEHVYDGALVEAVIRFQRRHGLEPDGRIGSRTLRALNTPLSRRITQLELTLERWRWAPRAFASPPIVVNIPEYRLRASDARAGRRVSMNVIVGRAYRHETPVLAAELTKVIFRPSWNVPLEIQREELLPRLERDPALLEREQYDVIDRRGNVVIGLPEDELLALLRSGSLRLRQRPGPHNALGLVKFVFPNRHGVYLHATPVTELFSRSRRDFSHGCIRVEDPVGLASWVLRDQPEWTPDRVREEMNGTETRVVNAPRPIPVLIVYGTAVVTEDREVRFLDDVYGHDRALEKALAAAR